MYVVAKNRYKREKRKFYESCIPGCQQFNHYLSRFYTSSIIFSRSIRSSKYFSTWVIVKRVFNIAWADLQHGQGHTFSIELYHSLYDLKLDNERAPAGCLKRFQIGDTCLSLNGQPLLCTSGSTRSKSKGALSTCFLERPMAVKMEEFQEWEVN